MFHQINLKYNLIFFFKRISEKLHKVISYPNLTLMKDLKFVRQLFLINNSLHK